MQLIYLSAIKASGNKSLVRVKIIHNGSKYEETQLFQDEDIKTGKLLLLEKVLKRLPWKKESTTVFLDDNQLYKDYTSWLLKNKRWPAVIRCQKDFSLVISFRNKGVLSSSLEEELKNEFSK